MNTDQYPEAGPSYMLGCITLAETAYKLMLEERAIEALVFVRSAGDELTRGAVFVLCGMLRAQCEHPRKDVSIDEWFAQQKRLAAQ